MQHLEHKRLRGYPEGEGGTLRVFMKDDYI